MPLRGGRASVTRRPGAAPRPARAHFLLPPRAWPGGAAALQPRPWGLALGAPATRAQPGGAEVEAGARAAGEGRRGARRLGELPAAQGTRSDPGLRGRRWGRGVAAAMGPAPGGGSSLSSRRAPLQTLRPALPGDGQTGKPGCTRPGETARCPVASVHRASRPAACPGEETRSPAGPPGAGLPDCSPPARESGFPCSAGRLPWA